MRTNIDIDDELMQKAMELSGHSTKREVVREALETLVRIKGQHSILKLKGKIKWEGNLSEMRAMRNFDQ
ncbi:MAG: type II toxin-antitoxin system VapB family antitoxin [Cyclobacteriaceae bacterium]